MNATEIFKNWKTLKTALKDIEKHLNIDPCSKNVYQGVPGCNFSNNETFIIISLTHQSKSKSIYCLILILPFSSMWVFFHEHS